MLACPRRFGLNLNQSLIARAKSERYPAGPPPEGNLCDQLTPRAAVLSRHFYGKIVQRKIYVATHKKSSILRLPDRMKRQRPTVGAEEFRRT